METGAALVTVSSGQEACAQDLPGMIKSFSINTHLNAGMWERYAKSTQWQTHSQNAFIPIQPKLESVRSNVTTNTQSQTEHNSLRVLRASLTPCNVIENTVDSLSSQFELCFTQMKTCQTLAIKLSTRELRPADLWSAKPASTYLGSSMHLT